MSYQIALELTKKFYGNYPGPTERTYDKGVIVANYFNNIKVRNAGVVAVAIDNDGTFYLGLSPYLQANAASENGYVKFRDDLKQMIARDFVFSTITSDDIVAKANNHNPGCA